jgi:hypothetical protein
VGDKGPGGGWIFFVDEKDRYPGFTYLEAAPEDVGIHVIGTPADDCQRWTILLTSNLP